MVISREDIYAETHGWEPKNGLDSGSHLWPPVPRLWHGQRLIRCEDWRGAGCCWLRMDDEEAEKDVLWGWISNRTQVRVWWPLGKFGCGLGKAFSSVLLFPSVFWPTLPGGQLCHQTDVRAVWWQRSSRRWAPEDGGWGDPGKRTPPSRQFCLGLRRPGF